MEYDMTLFITIASASASFVAIIGGLIASKLISINGERIMVLERISELNEIIDLKIETAEEIKNELEEDDALDFINEQIGFIVDYDTLSLAYDTDKPQRLEYEVLNVYWNKALELRKKFCEVYNENEEMNDDGIPTVLASEIADNYFDYEVCRIFAKYEEGVSWYIGQGLISSPTNNVKWYNEKSNDCDKLLNEIKILQLQQEQLERQKQTLVKPANMTLGLCIFGGFSFFNILIPLLFTLLLPNYSETTYKYAQYFSFGCLALGLILTFIYLIILLNWNPKEKSGMQKTD